ncbi:MAG: metal-sensing transcriptional repressor [Tissierellia bacterium]|nr:metal-sensing transcriptional repressor [Tissierellia bacterium]
MNKGKENALKKLKITRGQLDGVIKMLEEDRYCVDISTQILAIIGMLRKSNVDILEAHLKTCVADALMEGHGDEKIEEIIHIIDKYIK